MGFVLPDPINDSFPFGVDSNPFSPSVTLLLVKAPQLYELKCVDCYSRCFAKLIAFIKLYSGFTAILY